MYVTLRNPDTMCHTIFSHAVSIIDFKFFTHSSVPKIFLEFIPFQIVFRVLLDQEQVHIRPGIHVLTYLFAILGYK